MEIRYSMTYWYRNNPYITVNSFNEYFTVWNMRWSVSSIVHGTKSGRCQMVPSLSSLEEVQHNRLSILKQKGV